MKKMGKVRNRLISILLGLSLASFLLSFNISGSINKVDASVGNYNTDASTYYNSISATSGKQLAAQLHDLITSTHRTYTTYADNGANGLQKQTDQYYENGSLVSGYIYEFYSGVKWPNAWAPDAGDTRGGYNREHCWCQSNSVNLGGKQMWGESGGGSDMHHLRPVETRLNSSRNNNKYGLVSNRESYKTYAKLGNQATYALGGYVNTSKDTFEPLDSKKGDVARIIFYTYIHYNSYTISDIFGNYGTTNGSGSSSYFSTSLLPLVNTIKVSTEQDAINLLLNWNDSDPVDDIERRRNEEVAKIQGNRNPFIDNSQYLHDIFGGGSTDPVVNSVTINPSTLSLNLDDKKTSNLTVTVNVSNDAPKTVSWSSTNTNVATVNSSGLVTAIAKGSCEIIATSTFDPSKSDSCDVRVTDAGGGGTSATLITSTSELNIGDTYVIAANESKATAGELSSTYLNSVESTFSDDLTKITSMGEGTILFTLGGSSLGGYTFANPKGDLLGSSGAKKLTYDSSASTTWTISFDSSKKLTITNTTSSYGSIKYNSASPRFTTYTSSQSDIQLYKVDSVIPPTLTSISLNTSNVQLEFYVNDIFDYTGLVVTAHYDNGTEDNVTPTSVSSPDMSITGQKTVTVSYTENSVTKSSTYSINVIEPEISNITASVDKEYHPGETIVSSDITVIDNLGHTITDFTFINDGYLFTYEDAPSGGDDAIKVFENSITYLSFSADLEVTVNRVNYFSPDGVRDTLNKTITGVSGTAYTGWSNKTLLSGATYAGNSAGSYGSIQLRTSYSTSGIIITNYTGDKYITNISVEWNENTIKGRTINIYADTTGYTSPSQLYGDNPKGTLVGQIVNGTSISLNISGSYQYIGIRSSDGALYLNEIVVTYGNPETVNNLANYIMYEDTIEQCLTKFDIAKAYFENLSNNEKEIFMSSNDYVILNARERFLSWARHKGFEIRKVDGEYVLTTNQNSFISVIKDEKNTPIFLIVLLSTISISTIGVYFYLKRKKENY